MYTGSKKHDTGDDKRDDPDNASAIVVQPTTSATDDFGQKHCDVSTEPTTVPEAQESSMLPLAQEPSSAPMAEAPVTVPVTQKPSSVPKDEPLLPERPIQLPFQVQIRYTDSKGAKAVRVFTETKPITKDRKVAESSKSRFYALK